MNHDRVTFAFLFVVLIGMMTLSFYTIAQRNQCEQTAMAQNYSADSIKKICK